MQLRQGGTQNIVIQQLFCAIIISCDSAWPPIKIFKNQESFSRTYHHVTKNTYKFRTPIQPPTFKSISKSDI